MEARMGRAGREARANGRCVSVVSEISLLWGETVLERVQLPGGSMPAIVEGKLAIDPRTHRALARAGAGDGSGIPVALRAEDGRLLVFGSGRPTALSLLLKDVPAPEKVRTVFGREVDARFARVLVLATLVAAMLLAALLITPLGADLLSEDLFTNRAHTTVVHIAPFHPIEHPALPRIAAAPEGRPAAVPARPTRKDSPKMDPDRRATDRKKVLGMALLQATGPAGAASLVFGPGDGAIDSALGNLKGPGTAGDPGGLSGLNSRGPGVGGNIGELGLNTVGTRPGGRGGLGDLDLGGRGKSVTRIVPGKTTVVGGLSKDVIGDVIRHHNNQIRFCYERELQKDPGLQGKVALQFVIDNAGQVSNVDVFEDTTGNADLTRCMQTSVSLWKFPQPQGGGQVVVTYPWLLRAAGATD